MFDLSDAVLMPPILWNVGPGTESTVAPTAIGEKGDFGGKIPQAREIVEVEILQFVGPDHGLRLLTGLVSNAVPRHQLRAELGIEDGPQHPTRLLSQLSSVGNPADEVLDQGFGHTSVDIVVRHMVTDSVRRPA